MAIFKCKMCGGNLELTEGVSVVECEYCGTNQTVPNADDDKKMNLFARANRLRFACEFDKAAGIYESILADFPEEAEGYWGLVLCKYGIEYVDDPATAKKVPTCHRSSFESIMDDPDYEQALENADAVARSVYRNEAKQIEEIRKGIIEVSSKEEPYDIFICYKETAEDGQRTIDSVLAQDVYDVLTDKGYRTFFARITLEDKLGQEYEPYIFAALNSAKVMLAFGTDYEYFNAVWVKNEWSRYLKLMEKDKGKHLIPCYKGIDAYDIPKEFVRLQAQDLGKVGAVQDLVRGIEKLVGEKKSSENVQPQQVVVQQTGPDCESLLKRAFMFLEDGEWQSADVYCEKVLDIDPDNARAYLGKLMAELRVKKEDQLVNAEDSFEQNDNYKKIIRFGDEALAKRLKEYIVHIQKRNAEKQLHLEYEKAIQLMNEAINAEDYQMVAERFSKFGDYLDAVSKKNECLKMSEEYPKIVAELEKIRKANKLVNKIVAVQVEKWNSGNETIGIAAVTSELKVITNKEWSDLRAKCVEWENVIEISSGTNHVVALKKDGSVYARGSEAKGRCNARKWNNIQSIVTTEEATIGLKNDGTVLSTESSFRVVKWDYIVEIAAGDNHVVGLKSDGTVVATGNNSAKQCDVREWKDIVSISAGPGYTVGLKKDGTVIATGNARYGAACGVAAWRNIVSVVIGKDYSAGLRKDGTIVSTKDWKNSVKDWKDIVAIFPVDVQLIGLKKDGTLVATNSKVEKLVQDFRLFENFETLGEEREKNSTYQNGLSLMKKNSSESLEQAMKEFESLNGWKQANEKLIECKNALEVARKKEEEQKRKAEEEKRIQAERQVLEAKQAEYRRQGVCQHCGGSFKGLLKKSCTSCGKTKDY